MKPIFLLFNGFHRTGICQFTFNPIQDGRRREVQKGSLPVSFSSFWLLVLILFPNSCNILEPCLVPVSNYWTWTKTTPQKNRFFWSNPYKIWVMITSFIKMLSSYLAPISNFWTWTKTTPQKNRFFWSNPYKIWVMITSLIKMLY